MANLDASPDNELGKGLLDPAIEARLRAKGTLYARRIPRDGKPPLLVTCQRSIVEAYTDALLDLPMFHPSSVSSRQASQPAALSIPF